MERERERARGKGQKCESVAETRCKARRARYQTGPISVDKLEERREEALFIARIARACGFRWESEAEVEVARGSKGGYYVLTS